MRIRRRPADPAATLPDDLAQLRRAVVLAEHHLPAPVVESAHALLLRADQRQNLPAGRTVVALLGATGSGKSSLFNALVGREVARVAATRPTTSRPLAAVWGEDDAADLLDWLGVPERTYGGETPGGLVLVDLPDIDSTAVRHREVAARMAGRVDVLVWVLDPQKYADAVVHRDYLRPMAAHADVTVVVLNQVDTLSPAERDGVLADLTGLLERDGLDGALVLAASAREGTGLPELRARLTEVAENTRTAQLRLAADVRTCAAALAAAAETDPAAPEPPTTVGEGPAARLTTAAARAAGVDAVRDAVRGSYIRAARRRVGWPPVRWLARLRPDPLRRLHLDAPTDDARLVRTSLPGPTPVQEAAVRSAAHALAAAGTTHLPGPWRADVLEDVGARIPSLVDSLDQQIAGTELEQDRRPAWWRVFGAAQWLFVLAALVGGAWLGVLAVMAYLRLPELVTPMAGPVPWPTVLLAGGLAVGLVLALLGGLAARAGARRRARRVEHRLRAVVAASVREQVVDPLESQLAAFARFHAALAHLTR
ncbi:GTPase [Georgenia sp. SYP-B2076]|uniref:GTPase n=1 Tax=Georgenia sp. SYP-B2076 TaxID=2495881 RepID=UPI000F8C7846|nr:GTPase [Georgenia sp. SYP-B2076]